MINEVNAVTFRQNLGDMLNQVQYRHGKPVAALIDAQLFDRICRFKEHFDNLSDKIAEAYAKVPPEEGMAEIDAIVRDIRHP